MAIARRRAHEVITMWIVIVLALLALLFWAQYNRLVQARNSVRNAYAQIDVQLQRRYELIPNLVTTCKAYMTHERETLTQVTQARQQGQQANASLRQDPTDTAARAALVQAEQDLSTGLSRMAMLIENYPDLKADRSVQSLFEELASTENRVSFSRQAFNDAIMSYNNLRESLPAVLVAPALGFAAIAPLPEPEAAARQALRVDFS